MDTIDIKVISYGLYGQDRISSVIDDMKVAIMLFISTKARNDVVTYSCVKQCKPIMCN